MKIIECPRDAMQGLHDFVPTEKKIAYINKILKVGFDSVDFGSFVSPKAIPQMIDTEEVLAGLDLISTKSKLLAIVANVRGVENAIRHKEITYLGFPFSISETFQMRNTNSTIAQSLDTVKQAQELCVKHHKTLVVYISMGFGNPYGDEWSVEIAEKWVNEMAMLDVKILSLSDTIGAATPDSITYLFKNLIPRFSTVELGAHLHTTSSTWKEKIEAAFASGCNRFDGAIKGFGGCPMAADKLTGNMPTENLVAYFKEKGIELDIDYVKFNDAMIASATVFGV